VVDLEGADRYTAQDLRRSGAKLDDVDLERAGDAGRAGEHALHGFAQSSSNARRAGDRERIGAPSELSIEKKEGQTAEVITVKMGDQHRSDIAWVQAETFERG
jgi:hypothetical protein